MVNQDFYSSGFIFPNQACEYNPRFPVCENSFCMPFFKQAPYHGCRFSMCEEREKKLVNVLCDMLHVHVVVMYS